ncbi:MAG: TIGR03067 domain-containing protein [Gemmataceae bacterium]
MSRCCFLFLCLAGLASAGGDDARARDREAMQGDWACESLTRDGVAVPEDDARSLFRTVKGDGYVVSRFRTKAGAGTFTLDPSKTPREIDIVPEGPKKAVIKGIYKIDKDTLTICHPLPGRARPAAFESKKDSGDTLTVWKRER